MKHERKELFRNAERGKIAGVCAGIADYFGWETWLVRIIVVSAVLFGMPIVILAYIAAWFILSKTPQSQFKASEKYDEASNNVHNETNSHQQKNEAESDEPIKVKARIWQSGEPPKQALYDISRKFKTLEKKLQGMEHYVTSSEFTVSREINKL